MARKTVFGTVTTSGTGSQFNAFTTTPVGANWYINSLTISAAGATPAAADAFGMAESNSNASIFCRADGVQSATFQFPKPIAIANNSTFYVWSTGWAGATVLAVTVDYSQVP